jgi:hypothetical protein
MRAISINVRGAIEKIDKVGKKGEKGNKGTSPQAKGLVLTADPIIGRPCGDFK